MSPMSLATTFWDGETYAVVGVHAPGRTMIGQFVGALERAGKTVWLVDEDPKPLKGRTVSTGLEGAPALDGVLVVCAPNRSTEAVEACVRAGAPRIWLDTRGDSSEAAALARKAGIPCVAEACPLMTIPGAMWLHRFHGRVAEWMGKLPRD